MKQFATRLPAPKRRTLARKWDRRGFRFLSSVLALLSLPGLICAPASWAQGPAGASAAGAQSQGIGSLAVTGEVYVGETRATSGSTIYPGDTLRTAGGIAVVTTNGGSSLQLSGQSVVAFPGDSRYFAELKSGVISVKSLANTSGLVVKIGNFVVVPTNRNELTAENIEGDTAGAYEVTCLTGNVGVIPIQGGAAGLFLQPGQSASISPSGELGAVEKPVQGVAHPAGASHHTWIYGMVIGTAVAGGVAAAVVLEEKKPVSPVSP